MKYVFIFLLLIAFVIQAPAAELTESQVAALLDDWVVAQNTGSYAKYASMYSKNFVGIRRSGTATLELDHDAWLEDRKIMFRMKMVVTLSSPTIRISGAIASTRFEQTWESGAYKDKGDKLLVLKRKDGELKITREEMLSSKLILDGNSICNEYVTVSKSKKAVSTHGYSSKYSSILDKDCSEVSRKLLMSLAGAESAFECPAVKGWRLFKVYDRDSERSWLNIANKHRMWSTAEQVRINPKYFFGYFPYIDYSPRVEWRVSKDNVPVALIFRVAVTDPKPRTIRVDSWLSRLYVISLKGKEPRFCGVATTNEEARKLADKASDCTELLLKEMNF